MHTRSYYMVNAITLYRLMIAPFLVFLVVNQRHDLFKWMLAFSFLTDAVDGYLARRYKVSSIMGAKLDSIADDATILVAIIGMIAFKPIFINQEIFSIVVLLSLFVVQLTLAFITYGKITSFHTYGAKIAAILQGIFLLSLFFFDQPVYILFYLAVIVTALDLVEEIVLVLVLPQWKTDVKGLYWVLKKEK